MAERWTEGIWLGKIARSDEHILANTDGNIVKTGSIMIKPESESLRSEEVLNIKKEPSGLGHVRNERPTARAPRTPAWVGIGIASVSEPVGSGGGASAAPLGVSRASEPSQDQQQDRGGEDLDEMDEKDGPKIEDPLAREKTPIDIYIRGEDIRKCGYTANCQKCRSMQVGSTSRSRASHNPECRA